MAHGQGATSGRTPRSVGAYGSKRGKERQRRKRLNREADPRVQRARADTDANEKRLEAMAAALEADATPAAGAAYGKARIAAVPDIAEPIVPAVKPKAKTRRRKGTVPRDESARGEWWSIREARQMLRDGYSARTVMARTGWGRGWLEDIIGPDGYYGDPTEEG